jgi:amidase
VTARREFLKLGAGAAAAATTIAGEGGAEAAVAPVAAGTPARFAFLEAPVVDLGAQMAKGALTSVALTRAYLDRIAALDRGPAGLRSVIETNPDALKIAAGLDAERKRGPRARPPARSCPSF